MEIKTTMDISAFKPVINDWILFHGKQFKGDTPEIERRMYNRFVQIYYECVSYMTIKELESGFKQAAKNYKYFPKPSEILKYCPNERKIEPSFDYKALPQSEESKRLMENAMMGGNKFQVGEKQIRANFAHLAVRWPQSNWVDVLDRELEIDSLRLVRG